MPRGFLSPRLCACLKHFRESGIQNFPGRTPCKRISCPSLDADQGGQMVYSDNTFQISSHIHLQSGFRVQPLWAKRPNLQSVHMKHSPVRSEVGCWFEPVFLDERSITTNHSIEELNNTKPCRPILFEAWQTIGPSKWNSRWIHDVSVKGTDLTKDFHWWRAWTMDSSSLCSEPTFLKWAPNTTWEPCRLFKTRWNPFCLGNQVFPQNGWVGWQLLQSSSNFLIPFSVLSPQTRWTNLGIRRAVEHNRQSGIDLCYYCQFHGLEASVWVVCCGNLYVNYVCTHRPNLTLWALSFLLAIFRYIINGL